ncbi:ribonuclease HII [Halosegnis marinus]|uniref:Ribonuclease HII n=1 Tax=Halosegnis marinus TaxID=3034023 RepID=A0ABD5ZPH6_9EURY|nr:ribonuclease HII [Halosegnis sp. DT85]
MRFGVDEAGKGPVLGSMFAACVRGDPETLPEGVADSKRLAPARREELDAVVRERFDVGVAEIPVTRIDGDEDMNTLTVAAHAAAVDAGAADGDAGLCDAGDVSEARFARRVAAACERDVTVEARHRADEDDPLVGAASVVAKVARDAHVAALAAEYGDVGSGYPSDPTTRDFLREYVREHGTLPECARASWATSADVLAAAEQSGLDEF